MIKQAPSVTSSAKPHYAVLDGLRGVAALTILVFHYLEMIYPDDYETNWLGHGFLAVDFFFCLSGFVIGYAYDGRIQQIGLRSFFTNRLIRLHPLVIVGTIIGFIGYISNPLIDAPLASGWKAILIGTVLSLLLLPYSSLLYRGGGLFPFNTPSWSLFFEYIANIVYALVLYRLNKFWLSIATLLGAGFLIYCAQESGWVIGGWDKTSVPDGFARVAYSFTAGLLLFRLNGVFPRPVPAWIPILLLLGLFFFPHVDKDWITESLLVLLLCPLILSLGAAAKASPGTTRLLDFLGKLSYPLYMTHITTVWIFGDYYNAHHPGGWELITIVSLLIVFNLLVAWITMKWIDEPIRSWLKKKFT